MLTNKLPEYNFIFSHQNVNVNPQEKSNKKLTKRTRKPKQVFGNLKLTI